MRPLSSLPDAPGTPFASAAARPRLLVFDSGLGGLTVLREIRRQLPQAALLYLADNGAFPYGDWADGALAARLESLIGAALARFRPDIVVLACNTATTIALEALRRRFAVPFVGSVPPIKPAAAASRSRSIGLLATPATVRRPYVERLIAEFAADCRVHRLGPPDLARLAESKMQGRPVDLERLSALLAPLFNGVDGPPCDAVALGCTHYPLLIEELRQVAPRPLQWFDPAPAIARRTAALARALPASIAPAPTGEAEGFPDATAILTAPPVAPEDYRRVLAGFGLAQMETLALVP